MQNQDNGLCNILSVNPCGGGTATKVISSIVCEERTDEGIRFFKDGCCGTLRTIDGCGDKRVIEKIIVASRGRNPENPADRDGWRTNGTKVRTKLGGNMQHSYFRSKRQLCFGDKN